MTNPGGWNLYSYAGNNPLGSVDPSGLATVKTQGGVITATDKDGNVIRSSGEYSPSEAAIPGQKYSLYGGLLIFCQKYLREKDHYGKRTRLGYDPVTALVEAMAFSVAVGIATGFAAPALAVWQTFYSATTIWLSMRWSNVLRYLIPSK